jgi:hypothetical protein
MAGLLSDDDVGLGGGSLLSDADVGLAAPAEPADHGLSERQKLSPVGKALSPITSYPETYGRMRGAAEEQMSRGLGQIANPGSLTTLQGTGLSDILTGVGNVAAGGLNYLGSPVNAAIRSVVGQPIEDVTGIPREYTEFATGLALPGVGFSKLPKAPGAVAEAMPEIKTLEGPDLTSPEAEANRKLADEFDIPLTRGQATGDLEAIRREDMAARGAYGKEQQEIAAPRMAQQFEDIQRAGQRVGQQLNRGQGPLGTPADAASSLNTEIGKAAETARTERDAATAAAEQDAARLRQEHAQTAQNISEKIAGEYPQIEHRLDAAEMVGEKVRQKAAQDKAEYNASYQEAYAQPGEFEAPTFQGLGSRIKNDLTFRDQPVVVDASTPIASGALDAIDKIENLRLPNRADPRTAFADQPETINLQGLERGRKLLQSYYRRTQPGSEERRAVSAIISEFDNQVERAISDGLFSGDPAALEAFQKARSQYSAYQRTYRGTDDVGAAMRRIVERQATPEEISNMIVGSGKIGATGTPVRIADRLEQILGPQSPEWNAIRQAMWKKASQVRNAKGEIDPLRSATSIQDFSRSTLGRRMFPEEVDAMRAHAQGARDLESTIANLPSTKAAEAAQANYQRVFGGEGLTGSQRGIFQRMIEGTAKPEEVAEGLFKVIGGGNPGDAQRALEAVQNIVGKDSPVMGSVRQGVWQKLTQNPFGKDPKGQQMMVQSINEFLNGKGGGIARQLYSPEERALMNRYSEAVRRTIIPKYSRTNSDTAIAAAAQQHRMVGSLASSVASMLHTGPLGHLGGHLVSKMIANRMMKAHSAADVKNLTESLHDVVTPQPMTASPPPRPPTTFRPFPISGVLGGFARGGRVSDLIGPTIARHRPVS